MQSRSALPAQCFLVMAKLSFLSHSRQSELSFITGWLFKTVNRSWQVLLRPGSGSVHCYLCCVLLTRAHCKTGLDAWSEKEKQPLDAGLGKGMDTGQALRKCGYFSIFHTVMDRTVPLTSFEIHVESATFTPTPVPWNVTLERGPLQK